jgi:hypothetical protein
VLPALGRGLLQEDERLVGELAEVDLEGVGRAAHHVDLELAAGDDDGLHLGVLEAEALDGVGELEVDAEVVAVDVHHQAGDRAVEGELPVLVAARVGLETDGRARRRVGSRLHRRGKDHGGPRP